MINIIQGFKIGSSMPVDERLILTTEEMTQVNDNIMPDVYYAINSDSGELYIYNKSIEANSTSGKFRLASGLVSDVILKTATSEESIVLPSEETFNGKKCAYLDISEYAKLNQTGANLELALNDDYVLTLTLKDNLGAVLSTSSVDFPVEEMIINISYDETTNELILTLKTGAIIKVPLEGVIRGLATEEFVLGEVNKEQVRAAAEELRLNNSISAVDTKVNNLSTTVDNIKQDYLTSTDKIDIESSTDTKLTKKVDIQLNEPGKTQKITNDNVSGLSLENSVDINKTKSLLKVESGNVNIQSEHLTQDSSKIEIKPQSVELSHEDNKKNIISQVVIDDTSTNLKHKITEINLTDNDIDITSNNVKFNSDSKLERLSQGVSHEILEKDSAKEVLHLDKVDNTADSEKQLQASQVKFTDGKTFQQKLDDGSLKGPAGSVGPQGIPGPQGIQGIAGAKGEQGPQGPAGADGKPGPAGSDGKPGPAGSIGPQGPAGERGPKGEPFTYNDFTEDQLAKLKGPKGDKGEPGDTGAKGEQGIPGPKGDSGPAGATGPIGPQGPAGKDGVIGKDGAPGAKGEPGDTGPQGPAGPTGNSGVEISSITPKDPEIKVWIDTAGTSDDYATKTELNSTKESLHQEIATLNDTVSAKANTSALGDQFIAALDGTTLTLTRK